MTGSPPRVDDGVFEREQVVLVDRDGATEFETFAVVKGQCDRACRPRVCRCLPAVQTVLSSGSLALSAGGVGPAELGIERVRAAGRSEQDDRRRVRIDGLRGDT